jgi:hypothetical protein
MSVTPPQAGADKIRSGCNRPDEWMRKSDSSYTIVFVHIYSEAKWLALYRPQPYLILSVPAWGGVADTSRQIYLLIRHETYYYVFSV